MEPVRGGSGGGRGWAVSCAPRAIPHGAGTRLDGACRRSPRRGQGESHR
uniref:Predicted protein n=1 Tax=Hordeum vulgare subsp. vulgare TaxID=112509 RepID=F2CSQ1_HORVV|nr:predicted protein [Hordeum vulgare subsp. vulgare]